LRARTLAQSQTEKQARVTDERARAVAAVAQTG